MSEEMKYEGLGLEISGFSEVTEVELSHPSSGFVFDSPEQVIDLCKEVLQDGDRIEESINRCIQDRKSCEPEELVSTTLAVLESGIDLLQKLARSPRHPLDEAVTYEYTRSAVAMAADELRRQRGIVEAIDGQKVEFRRVLSQLAKAKGVTTKAVVNVERTLCSGADRSPELGCFLSLEDSLETRRIYGKMRRALSKFERHRQPPSHEEVVSRLRIAGTSFIQLRGHNCYPTLRVEDRFDFDRLWDRVYGWIQTEKEKRHTYQGWLIWQDVLNFVELLTAINFRQELREHDMTLATEVLARVEELEDQGVVGEQIASELSSLIGYNPDIDALIEREAKAPVTGWREQLQKIKHGG